MKMNDYTERTGYITFITKFFLGIIISAAWSCQAVADVNRDKIIKPLYKHSFQCKKIVRSLEQHHYLKKKFDDQMSSTIFHRYLKRLDPGKQIFTLQDINLMKNYQYRFDGDLKRGRLSFGFKVFNLFMARSKQRLEYITSLIKTWEKNLDFSKKESIVIDYDQRKWQTDEQNLYSLWKRELKNHIILLLLDGKEKDDISKTLTPIYSNRLNRLMQTDADDIFQTLMNSVTTSFDPHTQFFPPRASEDFDIHMSLSLEGIGAVLQTEYEYTKVVRLIPKGPADKSNLLMPGDKIIGVGQGEKGEIKDTLGQRIDHVVKLIRGPKNTFVRLKIIPAKKTNSTRTIRIKRDRVKLEDQSAKKKYPIFILISKRTKIMIKITKAQQKMLQNSSLN